MSYERGHVTSVCFALGLSDDLVGQYAEARAQGAQGRNIMHPDSCCGRIWKEQ